MVKIVSNHWGWTPSKILVWIRWSWAFGLDTWYIETPPTKCYKFLCFCWKHSVKSEILIKKCPVCKTPDYYYHDGAMPYICKNGHGFFRPVR